MQGCPVHEPDCVATLRQEVSNSIGFDPTASIPGGQNSKAMVRNPVDGEQACRTLQCLELVSLRVDLHQVDTLVHDIIEFHRLDRKRDESWPSLE